MADLLLQWDNETATADIGLHAGDFLMTDGIESAIIISLFTDRRAPADVELPAGEDRRGWWGDSYPDQEGDEMGSLLWLLERQVQTLDVLERTKIYSRDALQWMLDDGVLTKLEITATYPAPGQRELQIAYTDRAGRQRVLIYQLNPQSRPDPFAEPEGTPGEIQGTPGTEPIEATSWAPGSAGKPGEIHGTSGVAAIEADAWTTEPQGLAGEVGCGQILARDYLTADTTLVSADNDEITADAEF